MPPIHPEIYEKMNVCVQNNWNKERDEGLMQPNINKKIKKKEIIKKSFLDKLKQFEEIIYHNILDMSLDKNTPIKSTIDNKYKYINMNPKKIQAIHLHLNDKPRQEKSRLTDITYSNKGYNAKTPPKTKSLQQQKEKYLKVHIEPEKSILSNNYKKEINPYRLGQIFICYMFITS